MPLRRLIVAGFFAVLGLAATTFAAEAQTRTANKQIGGWTVYCRADGMTDRLSCEMFVAARRADGIDAARAPILLWREANEAPGVRLVLGSRGANTDAFLRVDRGAPAPVPNCRESGFVCMASIADDRRLASEIVGGASHALLRIGSLTRGDDWIFDLSEFDSARAELRRLRAGAGLPTAARPFDELERETAAAERARAAIDRQSAAVCGHEQGRDREFCLATARACAARGEDVAACVGPLMNRRRYDAHLDRVRASCRSKPPGEDRLCQNLVQLCFGAEKTIAAFDACFAPPPVR